MNRNSKLLNLSSLSLTIQKSSLPFVDHSGSPSTRERRKSTPHGTICWNGSDRAWSKDFDWSDGSRTYNWIN